MASRSLGTLYVDFMAKTSGLETDMGRASRIAKQRAREIDKSIAATMRNVSQAAKAIGVGVAAAVSVAAVAIKRSVDEMDQIGQTAQKIGVTTEALSALQYAAKLADVSTESLQGGMTKLAKAQADAAQGGKEQIEVFRLLEVEYKNADGSLRAADEVFADVAQRFSEMEDGAGKTALAVKLFGKAGANLIPLLNEGAAGLKAATDEARAFGLIVSGEAARAANEFNDNLDRMERAMAGAAIQAATELLPVMNDLSNQVVEMAKDPAFREDLANAIRTIGEAAIATVEGVVKLTNVLGFLYEEVRQSVGIVDAKDFVRLNEELEKARDLLALREAQPGFFFGFTKEADEARAEVKRLESEIQSLYDTINKKSALDVLQEIDLSSLPKKHKVAAPVFTNTSAADKAATDAARETRRQAKEFAEEQKQYTQIVRDLKLQALGDEARAVAALQDQYVDLNVAVKLGVVSQEDAAEIAAGLAKQWQDSSTNAIRIELLTDEQRAVEDLQAKYISLQNQIASGAITPELGTERAAGLAEKWVDAELERQRASRDALFSGLLTEEEMVAESYLRRRDAILKSSVGTEELRQEALKRLDAQYQEDMLAASDEFWDRWLSSASENILTVDALMADAFANTASSFGSAIESIVFDATSVNDAFQQMAEGLARSMINALAQMAAQWLIYKAVQAATQGTAATAAALAMTAMAEAQSVMAGLNAFASTAAIPYVGPAAAPAAAAAAIAATQPMAAAIAGLASAAAASSFGGAFDKGGEIAKNEFGLVGERGMEIARAPATGDAMLITKPTLIEGPAHVTGRVATAKLLREQPIAFAGLFDAGGFIPPGQVGMVGERSHELVNQSRLTRSPGVSMQPGSEPGGSEVKLRQIIVMGDDQIEGALSSDPAERSFITHASRNAGKLRQIIGR